MRNGTVLSWSTRVQAKNAQRSIKTPEILLPIAWASPVCLFISLNRHVHNFTSTNVNVIVQTNGSNCKGCKVHMRLKINAAVLQFTFYSGNEFFVVLWIFRCGYFGKLLMVMVIFLHQLWVINSLMKWCVKSIDTLMKMNRGRIFSSKVMWGWYFTMGYFNCFNSNVIRIMTEN